MPGPVSAPRLVLASTSAARLRILRDAGFDPQVAPSGADEAFGDLTTERAVAAIAERKAAAVAPCFDDALVLGCDSMLDVDGTILGKPASPAEAVAMWRRLSGNRATLYTGHCLIHTRSKDRRCAVAATVIRFAAPSAEEVAAYVATGEPLQMAGAFGLEGRSGPFIEGIEGDPSNVRGLSLPLLRRMLAERGLSVCEFWT
jgi:nucleoside triphosphate pyrophosphatase